jgi:hypothetical protein
MAGINTNDPNVSYNYQKNPNLTTSNYAQSQAGLIISNRDRPNVNRNARFIFPANMSTPNYGASSPTLLARTGPATIDGEFLYAGRQVTA